MSAKIIRGKEVASEIRQQLKQEVETLLRKGVRPGLAVILVGDDPASHSYVKGKEKAAVELGFKSEIRRLDVNVPEAEVLSLIQAYNEDPSIHGILVQLPLPPHISETKVIQTISPDKDVDGFHPVNVGKMYAGLTAFLPCTPHGIIQMMKRSGVDIAGKHAVVIGRSNIVGKPMAALLLSENATVTICHSRTSDIASITKQADILVAAVGKAGFVSEVMVKPGAVVIDVGVNRVAGKLTGDVKFEEVSEVAGVITPVPGGVGPMTITMLMYNTVESAKRQV